MEKAEKVYVARISPCARYVRGASVPDVHGCLRRITMLRYGPVSCVVNNAGCMMLELFVDQTSEEIDAMISTNIMGVINGMRACLKVRR